MSVAAKIVMTRGPARLGPVGPGLASLDGQLGRLIFTAGETEAKNKVEGPQKLGRGRLRRLCAGLRSGKS